MTPDQEDLLLKARESLDAARLPIREGFPGFAANREIRIRNFSKGSQKSLIF